MTDPHNSPTAHKINWQTIRHRWQRGESAYSISNSLGGHPSRQWISRKAAQESWKEQAVGIVSDKHLNPPLRSPTKDTPTKRERVLEILAQGGTYKLASAAIGVNETTLLRWRKEDTDFADRCEAAQAEFGLNQLQKIRDSQNSRDARFLLERHPLTRDDYGDRRDRSPKVVVTFNIARDVSELGKDNVGVISVTPAQRLTAPVSASGAE